MVDDRTARLLAGRLAREQASARLPSVAAGLARDGELVWSEGRGSVVSGPPPTSPAIVDKTAGAPGSDTQYRCGSITKTFVAVSVMRLRDAGMLELTDQIGSHIDAGGASFMTIAQLLSHSAGLRAETAGPWWERTAGVSFEQLRDESLDEGVARWEAGRLLHYSNVGYALLGELVGRLSGRPWFETVRAELLEPLGMTRTTTRPERPHAQGYAVHPHADVLLPEPEHDARAMAPAGQLWTTVADLARWAGLLAGEGGAGESGSASGAGAWAGGSASRAGARAGERGSASRAGGEKRLISDASLEEMREPRGIFATKDGDWTMAYGLGLQLWNENGRRGFGHGGSMPGFVAILDIDEQSRDAAVVLCNSTYGFAPSLGEDLLRILADNEPRVPPAWAPEDVDDDVMELLGAWYWGPTPFLLRFAGGLLDLQPVTEKGRGSRFRPTGDGTWTGLDDYYAGEPLVVVRSPDGLVSKLDIASFAFTRKPYDAGADVPGGVDGQGWGIG